MYFPVLQMQFTHQYYIVSIYTYRYIVHLPFGAQKPDSTAVIAPMHSHGRALLSYQPVERDSVAATPERSLVPVSKALTVSDQSVVDRHIQADHPQSTVVGSRGSLDSLGSVHSTICSCPAKKGRGTGARNTTAIKRYVH